MLSFATPLGFLGLLALPALLALHFLRSRPTVFPVSTLFLLPPAEQTAERGRRLRFLRNSASLWLQIAAVIVASLLLAGPRWIAPDATRTVVLLLDDSASMAAFREPAIARIDRISRDAATRSRSTDWILLTTSGDRLYRGTDRSAMLAAVERWEPLESGHSFSETARLARTLAGPAGLVLLVTDHEPIEPGDWIVNAVGTPQPNVGIAGIQASSEGWQAVLRNYTAEPQERRWRARNPEADPGWETLRLEPGEVRVVEGRFPATSDRVLLALGKDAFALDDRAPILRPQPKAFRVTLAPDAPPIAARLREMIEETAPSEAGPADLTIASYSPLDPGLPEGDSILFIREPGSPTEPIAGTPIASDAPLMNGLEWQALVAARSFDFPVDDATQVLLWAGERPLISEHRSERGLQLRFHFDPASSNLERLPAFPLLVHRWVEERRRALDRPSRENLETGQRITSYTSLRHRAAPQLPGFFEAPGPEAALLSGAAHFADVREADLGAATSIETLPSDLPESSERLARAQTAGPLAGLLLAALLLASWFMSSREIAGGTPEGFARDASGRSG